MRLRERDDRTVRAIGEEAFRKLARARVLVIGAGAVGNEVVKTLSLLNIGKLILCDDDVVEESNLNRCVFFRKSDCGRVPKVEAVARRAKLLSTRTQFVPYTSRIQEAPERVWKVDAVALCVDNDLARYYVNAKLLSLDEPLPVVDGAMGVGFVEVSTLLPGRTACLCCLWDEEHLRYVTSMEPAEECDRVMPEQIQASPALATLTSILGGLVADRLIRLLTLDTASGERDNDSRVLLGRIARFDLKRLEITNGEILMNPRCVDAMCRKKQRR